MLNHATPKVLAIAKSGIGPCVGRDTSSVARKTPLLRTPSDRRVFGAYTTSVQILGLLIRALYLPVNCFRVGRPLETLSKTDPLDERGIAMQAECITSDSRLYLVIKNESSVGRPGHSATILSWKLPHLDVFLPTGESA
jgi:hypothetical protein